MHGDGVGEDALWRYGPTGTDAGDVWARRGLEHSVHAPKTFWILTPGTSTLQLSPPIQMRVKGFWGAAVDVSGFRR